MTMFRRWSVIVLFPLLCLGPFALHAQNNQDSGSFRGASYLITVTDAQGAFASRAVVTLHGDGTLSAIDSGQGGPVFFFSSQLGAWKADRKGGAFGRTLDFDFPPQQSVARVDYTFTFSANGAHVVGTITLRTFRSNPILWAGVAQ